jgi:hypothetical protein
VQLEAQDPSKHLVNPVAQPLAGRQTVCVLAHDPSGHVTAQPLLAQVGIFKAWAAAAQVCKDVLQSPEVGHF